MLSRLLALLAVLVAHVPAPCKPLSVLSSSLVAPEIRMSLSLAYIGTRLESSRYHIWTGLRLRRDHIKYALCSWEVFEQI